MVLYEHGQWVRPRLLFASVACTCVSLAESMGLPESNSQVFEIILIVVARTHLRRRPPSNNLACIVVLIACRRARCVEDDLCERTRRLRSSYPNVAALYEHAQ